MDRDDIGINISRVNVVNAALKAGLTMSPELIDDYMSFVCEYINLSVFTEKGEAHDPEAWREENWEKQEAGVKFEKLHYPSGKWLSSSSGGFLFTGNKEDYREAQESAPQAIPHVKERALYWKQRAEGTNEVWQSQYLNQWHEFAGEPEWLHGVVYRPKPKTRTVYFAIVMRPNGHDGVDSISGNTKDELRNYCKHSGFKIIGEIESREVECE